MALIGFLPPPLPALLDDLDKELNNYSMRLREWYGWHFPELGKIVVDNLLYARTVKTIGEFGTGRGQAIDWGGVVLSLELEGKRGQAIDWGGVVLK